MENTVNFKLAFREHPILMSLSFAFALVLLLLAALVVVSTIWPDSEVVRTVENMFR